MKDYFLKKTIKAVMITHDDNAKKEIISDLVKDATYVWNIASFNAGTRISSALLLYINQVYIIITYTPKLDKGFKYHIYLYNNSRSKAAKEFFKDNKCPFIESIDNLEYEVV